jgi:hypothetical protein
LQNEEGAGAEPAQVDDVWFDVAVETIDLALQRQHGARPRVVQHVPERETVQRAIAPCVRTWQLGRVLAGHDDDVVSALAQRRQQRFGLRREASHVRPERFLPEEDPQDLPRCHG